MKKIFLILFLAFMNVLTFAQVNEGDTMQFWSVSYVDWPPLWGTPQRVVNAVCKKAGEHCYVFVEDVATQPSQAELDTLVSRFDNHFYPELTPLYGPVPDALDNDSSVFILALDESNWAGYFDPGQQMPDTFMYSHWSMHSSQREMIFIAADYFSSAVEIVAHELGHLLHWQQDHSPEPSVNPVKYWEEAWIDEGFSTFAAEYLTQDIQQTDVMHSYAYFTNATDIPLIYFSNYDQVLLWTVYMYEHFGGDQYIKMLIKEQANGVKGMRNALDSLGYSESFEDAFQQWIVANYIDDEVYDGGKYSYMHFNFPSAQQTFTHNVYPTGTKTQTVTPFGADYNVFNATQTGRLTITFNGDSAYKYRLSFIVKNAASAVENIVSFDPDMQNQAVFTLDSFGTDFTKVIMAVMCVDTTIAEGSNAPYSYNATIEPLSVEDSEKQDDVRIYPVPVSERLNIDLLESNFHDSCTYEITGSKGEKLITGELSGKASVIDVNGLKPSVYFLKITTPGKVCLYKFIKQ